MEYHYTKPRDKDLYDECRTVILGAMQMDWSRAVKRKVIIPQGINDTDIKLVKLFICYNDLEVSDSKHLKNPTTSNTNVNNEDSDNKVTESLQSISPKN